MEIYLVFSKSGTWLSRVLRLYLRKKYVHVSLSFDNKFNHMYSFGRVNPNNPFSGGFVIEDFRHGVYKKHEDAECLIYKIEISQQQYNQIKKQLKQYEINPEKYKYNALGLITAMLNIELKRDYHYFCTQFITEQFKQVGIINSSKPAGLFRPEDLILNIDNLEPIYEGYICEYIKQNDEEIII